MQVKWLFDYFKRGGGYPSTQNIVSLKFFFYFAVRDRANKKQACSLEMIFSSIFNFNWKRKFFRKIPKPLPNTLCVKFLVESKSEILQKLVFSRLAVLINTLKMGISMKFLSFYVQQEIDLRMGIATLQIIWFTNKRHSIIYTFLASMVSSRHF